MPDPAASALAVERPNIFAAPASHPRHEPRDGGIFDDAAQAESRREAPRPSRSRAAPRLRYLAPAVLAIVAAVSLLAVTQERTDWTTYAQWVVRPASAAEIPVEAIPGTPLPTPSAPPPQPPAQPGP